MFIIGEGKDRNFLLRYKKLELVIVEKEDSYQENVESRSVVEICNPVVGQKHLKSLRS